MRKHLTLSLITAVTFVLGANSTKADTVSYYVGFDGQATLTSGTYTGLANPNQGHLTLLFNHGDHFHGIGAYSYSGPAFAPTLTPTSSNNHIPEISSAEPPLALMSGSGAYAGRLVNQATASEYSEIEMGSIGALAGAVSGSPESVLFNSSSGRWTTPLGSAAIGLELLSATPGLLIGDASETNLFSSMSTTLLGSGSGLQFNPIFSTAAGASPGTYSATLRLVDLSTGLQPSGQFTFDFAVPQAVPEPGSFTLIVLGLLIPMTFVYRRAKARCQRQDVSGQ